MIMSLFTTVSFAATTSGATGITAITHDAGWPVKFDGAGKATLYYIGTSAPAINKDTITVTDSNGATNGLTGTDTLTYYCGSNEEQLYTVEITPVNVASSLKLATAPASGQKFTNNGKAYYYTDDADTSKFYAYTDIPGVNLDCTIASNALKVSGITVGGTTKSGLSYGTGYTVKDKTYYVSSTKTLSIPAAKALQYDETDLGADASVVGTFSSVKVYKSNGTTEISGFSYTPKAGSVKGYIACPDASAINDTSGIAEFTTSKSIKVLVPVTISKIGGEVKLDAITNGSAGTYTKDATGALIKAIASSTKAAAASANVTLTIPASNSTFTFYKDSVSSSNKVSGSKVLGSDFTKLIVQTTAGYIGTIDVPYSVVLGGNTYSGKLIFSSDYATAVKDTQSAHFFYEEFYLDSISGIDELSEAEAATTPSGAIKKYYTAPNGTDVAPGGATKNWSKTYTGYDSKGVAKQVVVTFEPVEYDILAYVEEGKNPFSFEAFVNFAERVEAEQENHYDIEVDHVEFPDVSDSKWTLEKSGKTIKTSDEFTASTIDDVYLDVTTAGYYDIPFEVHYDYKDSKNDTWSKNAPKYFKGLIRVYAALDGDLQYEVVYGETVKFDSTDFAALYRKLTSSKKVLETVKIDGLPLYGALYRNSKVTSAYAVDEGDVFYVDPASANSTYDLDKVTYWASKTATEEYSVYVPVTMDGTGGEEVAVVEILIKNGMPFKDIAKGSTFYEYIQYAYNNGIMGGKSETNFDAKSNITRAQLVTTLYRMAGSPTTYNGKVLPYTDTKYLSAEFSNALKWATAKGIATGYGDTFNPNSAVTRQAMVTILYRYAKTEGFGVGVTSVNNLGYFTDGAKVSTSMRDAMNWAVDYGLVSGNGSLLNPGGSTTRGAAAKILSNFHALYIG